MGKAGPRPCARPQTSLFRPALQPCSALPPSSRPSNRRGLGGLRLLSNESWLRGPSSTATTATQSGALLVRSPMGTEGRRPGGAGRSGLRPRASAFRRPMARPRRVPGGLAAAPPALGRAPGSEPEYPASERAVSARGPPGRRQQEAGTCQQRHFPGPGAPAGLVGRLQSAQCSYCPGQMGRQGFGRWVGGWVGG